MYNLFSIFSNRYLNICFFNRFVVFTEIDLNLLRNEFPYIHLYPMIGEGLTAQAARHCAASQALKVLKEQEEGHHIKSKLDPTSNPFVPGNKYQYSIYVE